MNLSVSLLSWALLSQLVHSFTTLNIPGRKYSKTRCLAEDPASSDGGDLPSFKHTLAILTMPEASTERIANEAILDAAVASGAQKLSVVLRCNDDDIPSMASLRRYAGEVYSTLWDCAMASGTPEDLDVVVYPQNLPNAAPEQWIVHQADLDSVCSHDSIIGWISTATGRGMQFQNAQGNGVGGLDDHVEALNADRAERNLSPVTALHVDPWPIAGSMEMQEKYHVTFIDDDVPPENLCAPEDMEDAVLDEGSSSSLLGGARIPAHSLFEKVAVGGTFDGMHFGHRKLLTLAVSSVTPGTGQLMVGVTVDEMLTNKKLAELIPKYDERIKGAKEFLYRLAPGMKNRIKFVPISDNFGPPGHKEDGADFDALVLSHETLANGCALNDHRVDHLGFEPLALLCTRRTEPYGMSSTNLRRLKAQRKSSKEGAAVKS